MGGSRAVARAVAVLVATLATLVGVQLIGLTAQRSSDRSADAQRQLVRDVEQIRYYDEVLTSSARLAAATGDGSYVTRYAQTVPELDRAIRHALSVVPDQAANDAVLATDRANRALVAREQESLRRLSVGDSRGAYALVSDARYTNLKAEYSQGMDVAIARMELVGGRQRAQAGARQRASLAAGVGAAALLALLGASTARELRRNQRDRTDMEERLREQAYADPLTGLGNRRLFRDRLAAALLEPGSDGLAVLVVDLDHFKTVNDTRGHAEGDALLVEVAARVADLLHGHAGALVSRLGGDELAVLLPGAGEVAAERVADRLVSELGRPYVAAPEVPVTASVGLAVVPGSTGTAAGTGKAGPGGAAHPARSPGVLLRSADLAMYAAKSAGRGRWCRYAEHMHTDLLRRVELESQLRDGLQRGELVVHYQPGVHLATGRLRGVEALVRWQHPRRGLLLPADFLPVAERSGLATELGRFVLEQACRHLAGWHAELGDAAPATVAVDVGPEELTRPGYAADVLRVLRAAGLAPGSLVLEVTESTVMGGQDDVVEVLDGLRAAGVRIAIDDFGTGHSSLARLRELPADEVKVDRSILRAAAPADGSAGDATVLTLIVGLAAHLGLDLVAEGIETPGQLAAAVDAGCTYGQGYLLGAPTAGEYAVAGLARPRS